MTRSRVSKSSSRRQLKASLGLLAGVLIAGTLGFYLLGDSRRVLESVYLTVMIVTTVGLKDQYPSFNDAESAWALVVMLVGVAAALYATGNLVAFLIGGELKSILGRRPLESKIKQLRDHFIVCGFGRMGRALCEALSKRNISFVVIDNNPERTAMAEERGYLYILGDATLDRTLETAHIGEARGLATCLKSDADNVLVTLSARGLQESIVITARAVMGETQHKLLRAGANRVICPPVEGAARIMQMLLHPAVDELLDIVVSGEDLEISKVKASELPGALGHTLGDLKLPTRTGLTVVVVVHGDGRRLFNPPPSFRIETGDELVVIGPPDGVSTMLKALGE